MFRILMVEDDVRLCTGWAEVFEVLGYDLRCYQRSLEALLDVESIQRCDLVITDYYLPDLNGVHLIERMRAFRPGLPAILLTGSREIGVMRAIKQLPHCVVLHKPVNIDELEHRILELCEPPYHATPAETPPRTIGSSG
jgi:CheY-like chemotaxis protein